MAPGTITAIVWVVAIVVVVLLFYGQRKRRRQVGAAASGSVYDWLNEDKRNAVEIIVEERAGARDPEDRDGNLPDLEDPTRRRARAPAGQQGLD
jgi:hypothetical protein